MQREAASSDGDADKAVGRRIAELRRRAGLDQSQLSERLRAAGLNWAQGTLSKVETGLRAMRFTEAPTVARVLEVDMLELTADGGGIPHTLCQARAALNDAETKKWIADREARSASRTVELLECAHRLTAGDTSAVTLNASPADLLLAVSQTDRWAAVRMLGVTEEEISAIVTEAMITDAQIATEYLVAHHFPQLSFQPHDRDAPVLQPVMKLLENRQNDRPAS